MSNPLIMIDGIAENAAAILARWPHHPVAMPADALIPGIAWTPAQEARVARKIRFSTLAGRPAAARYARALDIERFDASPPDFPPFCQERYDAGHDDPTAYESISAVPAVLEELSRHALLEHPWRLWVAWWWSRPGVPTRAQVMAELARYGITTLDPGRVWACQYRSDALWDSSVVYSAPDFSR